MKGTDYFIYTIVGHETLPGICNINHCSVLELIKINTQELPEYVLDDRTFTNIKTTFGNSEITVGQFLNACQSAGKTLPRGLEIRIPLTNTGGLEDPEKKYNIVHDQNLRNLAYYEGQRNWVSTYKKLSGLNNKLKDYKEFNCSVTIYHNNTIKAIKNLPVYPNEFSDSNHANFSNVSIFGRSVDYQIYQGSSRTVSFTLQLHEELCKDTEYIKELVSCIESANYPEYSTGNLEVPEVMFVIGSHFKIRGILTDCSASWKAPIINGRLVNCDLSVSITETTGPYSMSDIALKGGYR